MLRLAGSIGGRGKAVLKGLGKGTIYLPGSAHVGQGVTICNTDNSVGDQTFTHGVVFRYITHKRDLVVASPGSRLCRDATACLRGTKCVIGSFGLMGPRGSSD